MRVAIIGGGASGLAAAKHCHDAGFDCHVFEQTDKIGGVWNYTDKVGLDENGLPIMTSMYKNLKTNLPKEIMTFPGFKFPESEPKKSSYITQPEVLQYLLNYAEKSNIIQYVKIYRHVTNISPLPNNRWAVTIQDARVKQETTSSYDAIMVCNGHFSKPKLPKIPGMGSFQGIEIHSHDYRSADRYVNKTVLIIGAGPSGVDIAKHIATKATKVIISHRKQTWVLPELDNIAFKPEVREIFPMGAIYEDNTRETLDAIIYCTGYHFTYPFLSKECRILMDDNWVKPLYKQIINIYKPTMCFIGLNFYVCPFSLFDIQCRFFISYLSKNFTLPTEKAMLEELDDYMENRITQGFPKRHAHKLADYQQTYYTDLAQTGHIKPLPNVLVKLYEAVRPFKYVEGKYEILNDEEFIVVQ